MTQPPAPNVTTRRAAQSARIQTRGMLREQHNRDQQRIQQQSGGAVRRPNAALQAAKQRAKELHEQQQQQQNNAQQQLQLKDIYQTAMDAKQAVRSATGLVYDDRMAEHRCLWDAEYPECPERFTRVLERCRALSLVNRCERIAARPGTADEILLKHSREHYDLLASTERQPDEAHLEAVSARFDAIYVHPSTFELAELAVGATIELVDAICAARVQNGMAIIRPPGHHAMEAEYNGYCFFNNVAIAAQRALDRGDAKRILIVDWDVHHGQATQRAFYDDKRVLYFSVHRYENGEFWPNLRESDYDYVGRGDGAGYNFNVPLNAVGMQNADYLAVWQQLLMPVALEFQPDLVIVSAGYDAALGCPEGEMEITPACYAHLLAPLMTLAGGRVAVILEGGYCLQSLAEGASLTLRTLLGDPCPRLVDAPGAVSASMRRTILDCIVAHRPYWRSLQTHRTYGLEELNNGTPSADADDLHRVVPSAYAWSEPVPERFPTRGWYTTQTADVKGAFADRLTELERKTDLSFSDGGVAFVYDKLMLEHRNLFDEHPERPERLSSIEARFREFGLLPDRLHWVPSRSATVEELGIAHNRSHIDEMRRSANGRNNDDANPAQPKLTDAALDALRTAVVNYTSIYLHPSTFAAATCATGSLLAAMDAVLCGRQRSAICAIRPPGHHAEAHKPMGFCIFNNVAVAAQVALRDYAETVRRVLIVDWDVHHGNGTQHQFESNAQVLYISVHRYEHAAYFPKSEDAGADRVGVGAGRGFNVNVPWNRKGMGDAEYATVFQRIIMPIAYEFAPDLVLVSAGFDAAIGDPLGGCRVSPEAYGHFTAWLAALAGGRIIVCLEGGYNVNSVSYAMTMCAKALLGDPLPALAICAPGGGHQRPAIQASALETLHEVWTVQAEHWQSLCGWNVKVPEKSHSASALEDELTAALGGLQLAGGGDATSAAAADDDADDGAGAGGACGGSAASASALGDFLFEQLNELKGDQEMFAIIPLSDCPHVRTLPADGTAHLPQIDTKRACESCDATAENWLCLHCGRTECSRFVNGHMVEHRDANAQHHFALSLADLSVWCYGCEAYVDNPRLHAYKSRAHLDKFGVPMPWSYGEAVELRLG